MPKDQIALVAVLELHQSADRMHATPDRICVVNAHLAWEPIFKDVKVIQTVLMVTEVDRILRDANLLGYVSNSESEMSTCSYYHVTYPCTRAFASFHAHVQDSGAVHGRP
jgi:mRNA deadenylase 3'-5' endonuclease subunit Ccr4